MMETGTGRATAAAFPHGLLAIQILAVSVVGAILYGHTLSVPWYFDDCTFINNPDSLDPRRGFSALFTQRGFSRLSFALNYWADGLNPVGYHLVNIAIHLAAASLTLLLLRRVFPRHRWYPFLGALLFVAHPLQTQAVTYTVQRMTSLSALLFLLALHLFVHARELLAAGAAFRSPRHLGCYVGALLAGAIAILAKENAVLLPLALLLFARFFLPGAARWRPLLIYLAPFCLAPILFGLLFAAPLLTGSIEIDGLSNSSGLVNMEGNSPLRYLVTEFTVLWIYIRMLFLPYGQALDHGYPVSVQLITLKSVVGLLGLLALLVLAVCLRRRQPAISAGILWFFLTLAVESSVIPLDPLFEHRLYLPIFGFAMIVPALAAFVPRPAARYGVVVLFLLMLAFLSWRRNALWNDPAAFYEDNLRKAPHNERVYSNLGLYYIRSNRSPEAAALLERSRQISPRVFLTHFNLGIALDMMGRVAEAEAAYRRALQLNPDLAGAYNGIGKLYMNQGRSAEAFPYFEKALRIDPDSAETHNNLGALYYREHRLDAAISEFRKAAAINPRLFEAYANLGNALDNQGRLNEAATQYRKALLVNPNSEAMHFNLALALERTGDRQAAIRHYQEALRLQPDHGRARQRLGRLLGNQ